MKNLLENIKEMRPEEKFDNFWDSVTNDARALGIDEPQLKRIKRFPSRIDDVG